MPKKKEDVNIASVIMLLVIIFLILKFLGLAKRLWGIDPYGLEIEYVWGLVAAGFGLLYKEIKDLRRELAGQIEKLTTRLTEQGEEIARLEGAISQPRRGYSVG